jgi:hypothetical protein
METNLEGNCDIRACSRHTIGILPNWAECPEDSWNTQCETARGARVFSTEFSAKLNVKNDDSPTLQGHAIHLSNLLDFAEVYTAQRIFLVSCQGISKSLIAPHSHSSGQLVSHAFRIQQHASPR